MTLPHRNHDELAARRIRLTVLVGAPAADPSVRLQHTGVFSARGEDSPSFETGGEQFVQDLLINRDGRLIAPYPLAAGRVANPGGVASLGGHTNPGRVATFG